MSLLPFVLRLAAPAPQLEAYDRFLFLGPHPDDIEIGAGATAAKLAAMGKKAVAAWLRASSAAPPRSAEAISP